jgi:GntR family transcriptional regulator
LSTEQFLQTLQSSGFDKHGSAPLYQQLRDLIVGAVQERILQPNDRLPSERELSELLDISRITVHHALDGLVSEGWLVAQTGRGTFVAAPKLEQGIHQLVGLTEDMRRRGHSVSSQILEAALVPAQGAAVRAMALQPGEDLALLERVRLVDGAPLCLEHSYLRHRFCPGVLPLYRASRGSLYGILREQYGLHLVRAEQTYEATSASWKEAQHLDVPEGAPLLLIERTVYLDSGEALEYGCAWFRGDRYKFHTVLTTPGDRSASGDPPPAG